MRRRRPRATGKHEARPRDARRAPRPAIGEGQRRRGPATKANFNPAHIAAAPPRASDWLGPIARLTHSALAQAPGVQADLLPLHASAALMAGGALLGLLGFLLELNSQIGSSRASMGLASASACLGVLLGLWGPRWFVLARLRRLDVKVDRRVPALTDPAPDVRQLAATLTGTLIVGLGVASAVLAVVTWRLEEYRGWLVEALVAPSGLVRLLLLAPPLVLLVLNAAALASAVVALHGWQRALRPTTGSVVPLWIVMFGAAGAMPLVLGATSRPAIGLFSGLVLIFAAAIVAVARADATPVALPAQAVRPLRRNDRLMLLLALGAGAAMAAALLKALAALQPPVGLRAALATIGLAGATGLLVTRRLRWRRTHSRGAGLALLCAGLLSALPLEALLGPVGGGLRLAGVVIAASISLLMAGARVGVSCLSVQYALACSGSAAVSGFGLMMLVGAVWPDPPGPLGSLGVVLLAGLALIAENVRRPAPRWSEAVLVVGAVVFITVFARLSPRDAGGQAVAPPALPELLHLLVDVQRTDVARLHFSAGAPESRAAEVDLGGPRLDSLVVTYSGRAPSAAAQRHATGRALRRAVLALLPGGRMIVVSPDDALAQAGLELAQREALDAARCRITQAGVAQDFLMIGTHLPEWVARRAWPDDVQTQVVPLVSAGAPLNPRAP